MPRIKRGYEESVRPASGNLVERLANELGEDRASGQPVINEEMFPSKKLRVTVIWDEWDGLPHEERTAVILSAYEIAETGEYRDNIALASGVTFPEAYAVGMLPFQVFPALRKGDPVTPDDCRQAMVDEGASILLDPKRPPLRFSTEKDAEAAKGRLIEHLPNSDQVWVVTQDVGKVEDWAQR